MSTLRVRMLVAVHTDSDGVAYDVHGWGRDGKDAPRTDVRELVDECVSTESTVRYTWVEATVPMPEISTVEGELSRDR